MVEIPDDMDVPLMRRDTSKMENVRWLVRNLPIRNYNHSSLENTMADLGVLFKKYSLDRKV